MLDGSHESRSLLGSNHFGSPKFDVSRDRHEEWDAINKHDVTSDGYVPVSFHDTDGDVNVVGSDVIGSGSHSFPFQGSKVRTEDVFGCHDVISIDRAVREFVFVNNGEVPSCGWPANYVL
jgi:hypothetical protein